MLRNKISKAVCVAAVFGGGLIASQAHALTLITNTATANFTNENAVAQPSVQGSTIYAVASDPVIAVLKTADKTKGPAGTIVTWTIRVSYPRIADTDLVCGDDSLAKAVVVTDPLPAGFTYNTNSAEVSTDDGATWTAVNDGASALGFTVNYAPSTVTVNVPDLVEGQGDAVNCAASPKALAFRFKATKN